MIDSVSKNLWFLLTLIIPGFVTYGLLRVALLVSPGVVLTPERFDLIEASSLVLTAIILAISITQQTLAIVFEALMALITSFRKAKWKVLHKLFCCRFELMASNKISENGTRILGSFFMSLNILVGMSLLLFYLTRFENKCFCSTIISSLTGLILLMAVTTGFRLYSARKVIKKL